MEARLTVPGDTNDVVAELPTDVVGIFPDRGSIIRLVGALLAEQHHEWADGRRYLGLDILQRSRLVLITTESPRGGHHDRRRDQRLTRRR
jgi:hypothetical protein